MSLSVDYGTIIGTYEVVMVTFVLKVQNQTSHRDSLETTRTHPTSTSLGLLCIISVARISRKKGGNLGITQMPPRVPDNCHFGFLAASECACTRVGEVAE